MRGSKKASKVEGQYIERVKLRPCVACTLRVSWGVLDPSLAWKWGEFDHLKSGNVRRGAAVGICLCAWHHRAVPCEYAPGKFRSSEEMEQIWGTSKAQGSALFHETYGTQEELLEVQQWLLENASEYDPVE